MPKIYKYRIYCTTDNKWEYIWNTTAPTVCPVNAGHSVNSNSVGIIANARKIQEITNTDSPYSITGYNFYRANTASGSITINLKTATENKDRVIIIQKISGVNTLTVSAAGSETVGGSASQVLNDTLSLIKIQSNGTNWVSLDVRTNTGDDKLDGDLYSDNFEKGDVIINNGLDTTAISGADNTFLKADSTQASGLVFVTETVLGDSNVAAGAGINTTKLADGSVTNTRFQYINSLTSNAQTQISARVVGPASATDNAIARYDTTTGKLVQNSSVLIDDNANVTNLSYLEFIDISTPSNPADFRGRLYKKTGDDGIFWRPNSAGAELDLTRSSTLTASEVSQLENIDLVTITNTQWSYLGSLNQSLATTNTPTFTGLASTGNIDMNNNKIVNLALPTNDTDGASKAYVDSVAQGLDIKNSVRLTSTTAGTLATDFANGQTLDGVTLVTGDKILLKNQANPVENGIYIVEASGAPTRSSDMAVGASAAGVFTFVEEGTNNADSGWVCTSDSGSDIVGTHGLAFSQFSGAGQVTAGEGLIKTGNILAVNPDTTSIEIVADAVQLVSAPTAKGDLLTHTGAVQSKIGVSATNNHILIADSTQATGLKWGIVPIRLWIFQDVKTTGTFGGTATGDGTWRSRDINTTKINGGSEVTLASNQITVSAGTYHINIKSTFYKTDNSKIRLYNVTDTSTVEYSINTFASAIDRSPLIAEIDTYLSVAGNKILAVQYACDSTQSNDGLGLPNGLTDGGTGISELYTNIVIKKL